MILSTVFNSLLAIRGVLDCKQVFEKYAIEYSKIYDTTQEYNKREAIFCENLHHIEKHNTNENNWKMGVTEFADLTQEEFSERHNTMLTIETKRIDIRNINGNAHVTNSNKTVNWGVFMPPVKNQGKCGSCYSFGALTSIEARINIETGKKIILSEGEIIDCSYMMGNLRCNGGMPDRVFRYVKYYGVCPLKDYPYSIPFETCKDCPDEDKVRIKTWVNVESGSEKALEKALDSGPVAIAIDAGSMNFQFYKSGVFDNCGTQLNHAVTLFGYGIEEDGTKYWLVRNSWGESWGDGGNFKLKRGVGSVAGTCGILLMSSYPVVV